MAFCDYHKRHARDEFRAKVQEIVEWFQPLNPYKHDVRLFNLEKANYGLKDRETGKTTANLEPLYCLAVSAKRYCLFNRDCPSPLAGETNLGSLPAKPGREVSGGGPEGVMEPQLFARRARMALAT
jgi:hypothetical protein